MSPMAAATSSSEAFVMGFTDFLERDPIAREQWKVFIADQAYKGKRDPSLQDAVLDNFILQLYKTFPHTARTQAATPALSLVQPQGQRRPPPRL